MLEKLFSVEAEQSILGSILYDPECAGLAAELNPNDFSSAEHQQIFAWIAHEINEGRKPAAISIMPFVGGMQIGPINGSAYVARLATVQDRTTARESLAVVKGFAARRMMVGVADMLKTYAHIPNGVPKNDALEAIEALNEVIATARKTNSRPQTVFDAARDLIDALDDSDDGSLISTGIASLDRFMGGWPRGELSLIAGRPSMGKSALLSAIARRGAKKGLNLLIFSLEMPKKTLAARMLSDFVYGSRSELQIPYADILRKKLTSFQKQRLAAALEVFQTYSIKIDDQRGLTMPEILLRTMRHADALDRKGQRLDVVMVDHIGKIRASDRYRGNVTAETGEKSDALMTMAYETDTATVAAQQLNRKTEGREDKHPEQSDLRDSGNLEQDANTLIFPYRQSYYLERQKLDDPSKDEIRLNTLEKKKNSLEILVSKCRNGACGTVEVFVDMPSNHVSDMNHEQSHQ